MCVHIEKNICTCAHIYLHVYLYQSSISSVSSVQLLSRVRLFATPGTAACQASLFITNSQSSPKLMSIKSVMPSSHLILCLPLLLLGQERSLVTKQTLPVSLVLTSAQFSSVTQSCPTLRPHESQHTRHCCPSPTPGFHSNSTSIESVMPSSHLTLCRPLLLLPSIPPSVRVFSN